MLVKYLKIIVIELIALFIIIRGVVISADYQTGRVKVQKQHREHASLARAVFGTGCLLTSHQSGGTNQVKLISVRCRVRGRQRSPTLHWHRQKSFLLILGLLWGLCMQLGPYYRHIQQTSGGLGYSAPHPKWPGCCFRACPWTQDHLALAESPSLARQVTQRWEMSNT